MKDQDIYIIAGLGFGDEGKGTITEFLAAEFNAKATVRYNGGPQAAHHVVQESGLFHCFSQLASSSFLPNIKSHLAHSVLVKPSNLFAELDCISQKECIDIRSRYSLDPNCYVVTPWHGMLGRMEETIRGAKRFGSVGMGVGKAALERKSSNPNALQIKDFYKPAELSKKLDALWDQARRAAESMVGENSGNKEVAQIFAAFRDGCTPEIMKREYLNSAKLLEQNLLTDNQLTECIDGNLILEGAQGVLLDCQHGFLPHVTKTDTTFNSALPFLESAENFRPYKNNIYKVGVLRAYATRHGAGPFVTEDWRLNGKYPESHNAAHRWQGNFRIGHFDLVASRYAMQVSGKPDFLALTQLDLVARQAVFSVCDSYQYKGDASEQELENYFDFKIKNGKTIISSIIYHSSPSLAQQSRLTEMLFECIPYSLIDFNGWNQGVTSKQTLPDNLKVFLDFLQSGAGLNCPIKVISCGATIYEKFLI